MSIEEFQAFWRGTHASHIGALAGLRGQVQNHTVLRDGRPLLPYVGFDAIPELDFEDVPAMRKAFEDPEVMARIRADEPLFVCKGRGWGIVSEREIHVDGRTPADAVKLMTFVRLRPRLDRAELLGALRGPYVAEVARSRPLRHEQLIVIDGAEYCDAIDMIWFESSAAALEYVSSRVAFAAASQLAGLCLGTDRVIASPLRFI